MEKLRKFIRDEEGVTAIEYGMIAGITALAIVAVIGTSRTAMDTIWGLIDQGLGAAAS